jgi:hypothetical protein
MFRRFKLVILALVFAALTGANLEAQRTPRQRGWSYAGDPRAERSPSFRLPMEALLSANSPEDLIRASLEPPQVRRVIAKPQPPSPPAPVESLPDEEVDPFADDPMAEDAPADESAVFATEPAAPADETADGPADEGLTGRQLFGVLGDVAGSFLPDTSRVTEALPPIPGVTPPPGAGPPEAALPPDGADPFSAPPDAADPFADAPPVDAAAPAEADPFADGADPFSDEAAEPAAETPELEADPFQ